MFKRLLAVSALSAVLSGCMIIPKDMEEYDATPKSFVKDGLTEEQMIHDSVDCQDTALKAAGNYNSYVSSAGFTTDQVQIYDNCMYSKGYKEI